MRYHLSKLLCAVISLVAAFAPTVFKTFWRALLSRTSSSHTEYVLLQLCIIKCKSRTSNMTYIPIKTFASNQGCDAPQQMPAQCPSIGRRGQKTGHYLNLHVLCTSVRNCNVYYSYNSFYQKYLCQPYKIITIQLSWKNPKPVYFNCHWKSHWTVQNDKRQEVRECTAKMVWIYVVS